MERGFAIKGYHYERKPRQFDGEAIDPVRHFTNEYVAQAYLAVVLKAPSDARARKYKVWGELHSRIFAGQAVEPYIVAAIIARRIVDWLRASGRTEATDEIERLCAKRGSFHVARIAAYLWRGSDDWHRKHETTADELDELEKSPEKLEGTFQSAFDLLVEVVKASPEHVGDVDRALKSAAVDRDIDKRLYARAAGVAPFPVTAS